VADAIRVVVADDHPLLRQGVITSLTSAGDIEVVGQAADADGADPLAELSARERQVLELVGTALSNQEIGQKLGLAEKMVKHYMTNILTKLQVRSRVEAALLAHRARLTA